MMKKVLTALIAALLVAVLCVSVLAALPARKESGVVELYDCDRTFGGFSKDTSKKVEGTASLTVTLNATSFAAGKTLDKAVNISECDSIAFDLYVSDVEKAASLQGMYFEISSSGQYDVDEYQWDVSAMLRDDRLEEGWNTIYMDFGTSHKSGECDLKAINYFRFYTFQNAASAGLTIKLDNIRACYTGGEDYSDLNMDFYNGDNGDKDVIIQGQPVPDLDNRDEGITKTEGLKK